MTPRVPPFKITNPRRLQSTEIQLNSTQLNEPPTKVSGLQGEKAEIPDP